MPLTREQIAAAQGAYFLTTGVWPFLSRRKFEAVTGPKSEWWLVLCVGGTVGAIGAGMLGAAANRRVTPEIETIAVGTAAALGAIDVGYFARGRLRWTYLLDAAAEAAAIAAWAAARRTQS